MRGLPASLPACLCLLFCCLIAGCSMAACPGSPQHGFGSLHCRPGASYICWMSQLACQLGLVPAGQVLVLKVRSASRTAQAALAALHRLPAICDVS